VQIMSGRRVSLVLCSGTGEPLGTLPAFSVDDPWWPEVLPVVEAAREHFAAEVVVLRLLDVSSDTHNGGAVTYLAELIEGALPDLPLTPPPANAAEEGPLRAGWARPGGVRSTIAWADGALEAIGRRRTGPAIQVKTWNLSSILRLPTDEGDVWCKSVPPFLAHEGTIIALVGADEPALVPSLLASDPATGTVLMSDVPGDDDWGAPEVRLHAMVRSLVGLQVRWIARIGDLLSARLPDWRSPALTHLVQALMSRPAVRMQFTDDELPTLDALTTNLAERLAALDACGIPETLVHGDFHPGNWRSDGRSLVLLDWGDSGVGHPLLDLSAFEEAIPDEVRSRVRATWVDAWRAERPGSDPSRAADLIAPISAMRRAVIYQGFLDGIEPSERPYHATDVRDWLLKALERTDIGGRGGS
jgi:Phosphotransferase enzyme family